jgi:hypothetical protein
MAGWPGSGANEYVQARLILNDLFDHAILPYNKFVHIFTLRWGTVDFNDPGWGLMHDDECMPKISGTAVHNLMAILSDVGGAAQTFTTAGLGYSLTGMPSASGNFLLQKSNGVHQILLWNETPIWNNSTATQVAIPNSAVTISLPPLSSGKIYNPLQGTAPISTFTDVSQLTVMLNDSPLIIELIHKRNSRDRPNYFVVLRRWST